MWVDIVRQQDSKKQTIKNYIRNQAKWCADALKFFSRICIILLLCGGVSLAPPPPTVVQFLDEVKPAFKQRNIAIVFSSDDNYVMYLGVCLRSLIDNADPNSNYDIWILDGGIAEKNRKILMGFMKDRKNFSLRFFGIGSFIEKYKENLHIHNKWLTIATYYRLFIPQIFFHYRQILYLDCDIVINADVAKLYNMDLEGKSLGVVRDFEIPIHLTKHAEYIKGKGREKEYFNAGVLLFDIEKNFKNHLTTQCLEYIFSKKNDQKEFFEDQDALNVVCCNDVKFIDDEWNFSPDSSDLATGKCAKIIHFMGSRQKPWRMFTSLGDCWWHYAEKTSFYRDIMTHNKISIRKINIRVAYYFTALLIWLYRNTPLESLALWMFESITELPSLAIFRISSTLKKSMNNKDYPSEYVYLLRRQKMSTANVNK
jgi:lipopolysaccharide biosynthesis glycosyltransferase